MVYGNMCGTSPLEAPLLGAEDMEQLREQIFSAHSGTGEVGNLIANAKFRPRQAAFTSLLQFASKARQPEKAIEIFESLRHRADVKPNTFSYSALISALARAGRWQDAERYFLELAERAKEDDSCKPNTVTYAALISAYEKGRQYEKAFEAFDEQMANNIEPDVITFGSLLNACERAGASSKSVELLDKMHSLGISGPSGMYLNAIASCGPRWQDALDIFLGMQCAGVEVSPQCANLLMASLCAGGQREHAVSLLRESMALNWSLSLMSYSSLMRLLAARGDWQWASTTFWRMATVGLPPDEHMATALIAAHRNGGDRVGASRWTAYFTNMGLKVDETPDVLLKPVQHEFQQHVRDAGTPRGRGMRQVGVLASSDASSEAPSGVTESTNDE